MVRQAVQMAIDLTHLPSALLTFDEALTPLSGSRKGFSIFGIRLRREEDGASNLEELSEAICSGDFEELLRGAASKLNRLGSEADFRWERDGRTYTVRVSRVADEDDRGAKFSSVIDDVTQQVLHEQTYVTTRGYLESVLNNVQVGVIVMDHELRITTMNQAQERFIHRLGMEINWLESVGIPAPELLTDEAHGWDEISATVVGQGTAIERPRQRFETKDGDLVLSISITPLVDQSGQIVGAIQVSEDVTERVHLEEELHEAEIIAGRFEAVRETAITVNHEINNPLTTILAIAQVLLMSPDALDEKTLERLQTVEREVKRIAEVTQRLQSIEGVKRDEYIPEGPKMIDIRKSQ